MLTFGPRQFDDDEMLVMAIINRTPDSFYDRGASYAHDAALDLIHAVERGIVGGVKAEIGRASCRERVYSGV